MALLGRLSVKIAGFLRDLGPSGVLMLVGIFLLTALLPTLFITIRPPTVDDVEMDILSKWIDVSTAESSETLASLLVAGNRYTCERLLAAIGFVIDQQGDRFVIPTAVEFLRVRDKEGELFARWKSSKFDEAEGYWKDRSLPLTDREIGVVGSLEIRYKFYPANRSGLEHLPSISNLRRNYIAVRWLIVFLAVFIFIAVLTNVSLMRERAARLQSQQVTLDLARQMCHELRNGLWAFSLEGKNVRQLFQLLDDFLANQDPALEAAAAKAGLDERQRRRLRDVFRRMLADRSVDPLTDLQPCNDMAKEAHQHVESFSRYINLTVEELDRNLLGGAASWDTKQVRVSEAWAEACELLEMRFRSAGASHHEEILTDDDWIQGDRRALVHVFVNLAKNAIEAMREQPGDRRLTFTATRRSKSLHCIVHNTGKPIDPEALPRIFDRGFSTKRGAGRGTGLALVLESVQKMDGAVSVVSDAQRGTSFELVFEGVAPPVETQQTVGSV